MGSYSKAERETIIRFDEDRDRAIIETFSGPMQRKTERLMEVHPSDVVVLRKYEDGDGLTVSVPKSWIKINAPRVLSNKERQRRAEQMRKNTN